MPDQTIKTVLALDGETKFKDAIKNINKELELLNSETRLSTSELNSTNSAISKLTVSNEALAKKIDLQKTRVAELRNALEQAKTAFGENSNEAKEYQIQLNNAEASLNKMNQQLVEQTAELKKQQSAYTALSKDLADFSAKSKKVGAEMKDVGKDMTMGLTVPIIGVGTAAVNAGMEFEAAMDRVMAISGATEKELEKLADQALQLGKDTAFSASESAAGMENLASAGFEVNEITAAMPGLLDLAASGGLGVAEASDIASSALRGFGLDAAEAGHVADVLAQVAADTNASVTDMGMALKYAAPPAKALGMTIEEVSAAVGIMANSGIKGEQAGTTLRGALIALASPSQVAATMMESIGFKAFDAAGNMLSFDKVIENLQRSTESLTQEQKANALATIFGNNALSGMMTVVDAGPTKLRELTRAFENSDGAAKAMAETMLSNGKGSIEAMMGSLETAGIAMSETIAPAVVDVAESVTDLANKFSDLDPEAQKTILALVGITAAAGPAIYVTGTLISAVSTITGALSAASAAAAAAGLTMTALTGPVGLAVIAIGAAAAALALFGDKSSETEKRVEKLTKKIKDSADAFSENTKEAEDNAKVADDLADQLFDVSKKEKKTNEEKLKMVELVKQLNKLVPALTLEINEQTGELSRNEEAIKDIISARKNEILLQVYEERLLELYREKVSLADEMKIAQEELTAATAEYQAALEGGMLAAMDNAKSALDSAQNAVNNLTEKTNENVAAISSADAAYNQAADSIINANKEIGDSAGETTDKMSEEQLAQIVMSEETAKALEDLANKHIDEMGSIEDEGIAKTKLTASEVKKNLEQQIEDFRNWQSNIQLLAKRVPGDVLAELQALGPAASPIIAELIEMNTTDLWAWIGVWQEKSKLAVDTATAELGLMPGNAATAARDTTESLDKEFSDHLDEVKAATKPVGGHAIEGIIVGMDEKKKELKRKIKELSDLIPNDMMGHLGINSPSKVTTKIGEFTGEGYIVGLDNKIAAVRDTAAELAAASIPGITSKYSSLIKINQASAGNASVQAGTQQTIDANAIGEAVAKHLEGTTFKADNRVLGRFVREAIYG